MSRIDVQRRRHRYSRPGGQATADQESAFETADSQRATIGLATAAKSEKREITTGGGSHPNHSSRAGICDAHRGLIIPGLSPKESNADCVSSTTASTCSSAV